MRQDVMLNIVALAVLVIATALSFYWIWGLLFLYWAVLSLRTGEVFLLTSIRRVQAPVLYWGLTVFWFGFGVIYLLAGPVWPVPGV